MVSHYNVDRLLPEQIERCSPIVSEDNVEVPPEHDSHRIQNARLVVYEQDGGPLLRT
jgi:hypothetical protein